MKTSTYDESERAFLQRRIALFAFIAASLTVSTDIIDLFINPNLELSIGFYLDKGTSVVLLVMWLVARRGAHSVRFLRVLECTGVFVVGFLASLLGRYIAEPVAASFTSEGAATALFMEAADAYVGMMMIVAGAITFTLRAALIPSPPRLTAFVTGVLGQPFMLVPVFFTAAIRGADVELRSVISPGDLLDYGIWWGVITAVCIAISSVIYGLRKEVREAQRLGQYTLVEKLGEGGMGAVYRAEHTRLRRPTAVKLLPPDRYNPEAVDRFESEVQLTAELTHPNTVTVFDYGRTDDGVFYYAMELLDGATLEDVVRVDGPQPTARVVRILEQAAGALEEAHTAGLMHRDIKPANIMLAKQGIDPDAAKLLDFGLARTVEQEDDAGLTRAGMVVGTPLYMAPEVISDPGSMSASADLYALGAVAYFLVTGTDVFSGKSAVEICAHHLHTEPEAPSARLGRDVAPELERLILECLAKSPNDRPASARVFVDRLRTVPLDSAWTLADAQDWWARHGNALKARQSAQPVDVALTIA